MSKKVSKFTIIATTAVIGLSATAVALHEYSIERSATVRAAVSAGTLPSTESAAPILIAADKGAKAEG